MSKHDHDKHPPAGQAHEHHARTANAGLHKDWRTWVVVALMLAAMAAYILSDDEAIQPGGSDQPQVPAMAE